MLPLSFSRDLTSGREREQESEHARQERRGVRMFEEKGFCSNKSPVAALHVHVANTVPGMESTLQAHVCHLTPRPTTMPRRDSVERGEGGNELVMGESYVSTEV